jgi:hypothetical protein
MKVLRDSDAIRAALNQPSWSLHDLLEKAKVKFNKTEVSNEKVLRVLKMSGFKTDIPSEKVELIKNALKLQMLLVGHLYNENAVIDEEESNDSIFRLIASDHDYQKPITLKLLLRDIEDLPNQVDSEKGELGFKINDLDPKNKTFFTVRLDK